jgi:hypothetical protein
MSKEFDELKKEITDSELNKLFTDPSDDIRILTSKNGDIIKDPWQAYTLRDAYAEREPIQYVAGRLFEKPSLNILYGAPGTLKSFLLADLLICVSAGDDWLMPAPWQAGGASYKTKKSPAIWLDFDNGARRTLDRFKALAKSRSLPEDTPAIFYSMPDPWLVSTDRASLGMLELRIRATGAEFVCIDNLGAVLGDNDENTGDMAKVMSNYRRIAENTGAAVTLIHHQRKGNGLGGRMGDTLRGHSSIEAALDLALLVEREPYAPSVSITATKTRGDDVLPFRAQFAYTAGDDGHTLQTAQFWGLGNDDNLSDHAITREVKNALADKAMNQTELIKAVKEALPDVGMNRIRDNILRLAKNGDIHASKGDKFKNLYSV